MGADGIWLAAQGMGGSGKSVVVAALARDAELCLHFEAMCFVAVGQEPSLRDLQRSRHAQICGRPLDAEITEDELVAQALQVAAKHRAVSSSSTTPGTSSMPCCLTASTRARGRASW